MGDPLYDERRRLEKENEVLRLRRENSRLKEEAEFKEQAGVIAAGLAAFFTGNALIMPYQGGWFFQKMDPAPPNANER